MQSQAPGGLADVAVRVGQDALDVLPLGAGQAGRRVLCRGVTGRRALEGRQDAVEIDASGTAPGPGRTGLQATYIASEFLGSRFVYIFRLPNGGVFEVERHLSHSDPVTYKGGEACSLAWNLSDALVFDPSGAALETTVFKGAA